MIEIIPFDIEKIKDFVYDGVDKEISGQDIKDIAEYYSTIGEAYIGYADGKVIGVGGFFKLWRNWGSAWLFLNKEASNYKKSVFKEIVQRLNNFIKTNEIKTMTVECLDQSMEANRLLNHLGFVKSKEIKLALYGRKI